MKARGGCCRSGAADEPAALRTGAFSTPHTVLTAAVTRSCFWFMPGELKSADLVLKEEVRPHFGLPMTIAYRDGRPSARAFIRGGRFPCT